MTKADIYSTGAPQQTSHADAIAPAPLPTMAVVAIPLLADGSPDWEHRRTGQMVSATGSVAQLELDGAPELLTGAFVLVLQLPEGWTYCAGLEVQTTQRIESQRNRVEAIWGGLAGELLRLENLTPRFVPESLEFKLGVPEAVLRKWEEIGVLQASLIDRVQVCPACQAFPTYRQGCTNCGSVHLAQEQFIHHLGCAHVGPVKSFESSGELACPKCRTRRLVPGSDFEYLQGPFTCLDCHWSDTQLEDVGQCLRCALRFPRHQVQELELKGYDVNRLDPLVFFPQP